MLNAECCMLKCSILDHPPEHERLHSIFTSQHSRCECGAQTGKNHEGETHSDQTQCHHESQTLWTLEVLNRLLRLRIGTTRGGLLDGLQHGVTQLPAGAEDQHFNSGEDSENAKAKNPAQRAQT